MTSVAVSTPDNRPGGFVPYYRRYQRRYKKRTTRKKTAKKKTAAKKTQRVSRVRMSKFLLANIDPFNPNCDGAKVPDSNTYPSTAITADDEVALTTDGTHGVAVTAFRPYLQGSTVTGTAGSANSWTWAAAYGGTASNGRYTSIAGLSSLYRPVAHGIRLYAPTAPTSTTGFVHVAVYADTMSGTTWAFPSNVSDMNNCMFYQRYPLAMLTQKSITVVNKFLDQSATRYVNVASDVAGTLTDLSFHTPGWGTILVAIEGAPVSTKALVVETITRIEAIPHYSGVGSSTPAAPYNVQSLEGVSRMAGHTPGAFVEGEEQTYFEMAAQALGAGAHSVLNEAIPRAAYGLGRAATYAGLSYVGQGIAGVTSMRQRSGYRGGLLGITAGY